MWDHSTREDIHGYWMGARRGAEGIEFGRLLLLMFLPVEGKAKENDLDVCIAPAQTVAGKGFRPHLQHLGGTGQLQLLKSTNPSLASHNSIYSMRCCSLRTYIRPMQPAQRLPDISPFQKEVHRSRKLQYEVVSVPGNVKQRKGHSSRLLKDVEEELMERNHQQKGNTLPFVLIISQHLRQSMEHSRC